MVKLMKVTLLTIDRMVRERSSILAIWSTREDSFVANTKALAMPQRSTTKVCTIEESSLEGFGTGVGRLPIPLVSLFSPYGAVDMQLTSCPIGMTYEGELQRGVPHGRGVMRSKLTKWAYEGTFEQ